MNNQDKKCEKCGELLKPTQYATLKRECNLAVEINEDLVCRNYPACKNAEKEI